MKSILRNQLLVTSGVMIGNLLSRHWGKPHQEFRKRKKSTPLQQAEKIAACTKKQARKHKARLHCYRRGVLHQPIINHPTYMTYFNLY